MFLCMIKIVYERHSTIGNSCANCGSIYDFEVLMLLILLQTGAGGVVLL